MQEVLVIQYISKTKRYFDVKVTFHFHDTKKLFFFSLTNFKSGMSSLQKKNIKNLKKKPTGWFSLATESES